MSFLGHMSPLMSFTLIPSLAASTFPLNFVKIILTSLAEKLVNVIVFGTLKVVPIKVVNFRIPLKLGLPSPLEVIRFLTGSQIDEAVPIECHSLPIWNQISNSSGAPFRSASSSTPPVFIPILVGPIP